MKKFSDAYCVSKRKSARKLANECLNATDSGLPDANTVNNLAIAILTSDLATGGSQTSKHAGQDADQESMLESAYGDMSQSKDSR